MLWLAVYLKLLALATSLSIWFRLTPHVTITCDWFVHASKCQLHHPSMHHVAALRSCLVDMRDFRRAMLCVNETCAVVRWLAVTFVY